MDQLYSPKTVQALLAAYGLAPLKRLGQNFLIDRHIVERIAQAACQPGECVLEIGPGLGVLTNELAKRAQTLVAIELDPGMNRVLQETMAEHANVSVLQQHILKTDLSAVCQTYFQGRPFRVVGNLPYYITSKCLMHVLESGAPVQSITAMMQKEVAQRLAARPGGKEYGAITASLAYFGKAEMLFPVSRENFYPRPDVDSCVVQICIAPAFSLPQKAYRRAVSALFGMRRKTALNNFKRAFPTLGKQAAEMLEKAGIAPTQRAETIAPPQFACLGERLEEALQKEKK